MTKLRNANDALGSIFNECDIEEYIKEFKALFALIPNH